jgi:hypothetical protein
MVRHSVPETYENDTEFDLTYIVLILFSRMVRHSVPETYENDTEFDLTYMVLVLFRRMVRHSVPETYENDTEFDLTYMVLVFVTFLPTLILPWFYAHWILIGKVLVREYLMIYRGPAFLTVV